ncbi:MAG TPA: translation initiation factor [Thermoanaerobaculia bacterium]
MSSKLVWTSDPEQAKKLRDSAPATKDAEPKAQTIRVQLDKKRRAGKTVTVASGFELTPTSLSTLGSALKKKCGSGGTAKGTEIEIQGDHAETIAAELTRLGYRVKTI